VTALAAPNNKRRYRNISNNIRLPQNFQLNKKLNKNNPFYNRAKYIQSSVLAYFFEQFPN
jgi:hypothetical protein